jgi:hypothetical protein
LDYSENCGKIGKREPNSEPFFVNGKRKPACGRETMSDIFISYAREDRKTAQRLAKALEAQGWSVRVVG